MAIQSTRPLLARQVPPTNVRSGLLANRQFRRFEADAARVIRAIPVRVLRQVLLVIVSTKTGKRKKSPELPARWSSNGRLPVDVVAEIGWRFPAEKRGSSAASAANPLVPRKVLRLTRDHAFSPTADTGDL
jgi:hypothetical protein